MSALPKLDALSDDLLLREQRGAVAILALNRPAARNSLSEELIAALHETITAIGTEQAIRAVVLTANGPVFSSGHDLKQLTARRADADKGRAYFEKIMRACSDMMLAITRCPKPVIAAVNGTATAAGCQLVATCDLAVASSGAKFCTPGVNIGLFCSTPMVALSRTIGRKRAMEMLLLGEMVGAMDAMTLGLINRVAAPDRVIDEAVALAQTIAAKSPATVAIGKEAFYQQAEMPLDQAYAYAANVMVENMLARDAEEGIAAFIEKRKPVWRGA